MAKYIDADVALDTIDRIVELYPSELEKIKQGFLDMPAADVEPVRKWISVDERLPEIRVEKEYYGGNFTGEPREAVENTISDPVLVAIKDWHNRIVVGTDFVYDGKWFNYNDRAIIAWMPLPEPPKMDGGSE